MARRSFAQFHQHVDDLLVDGRQLEQRVNDLDVKIDEAHEKLRVLQAQRKVAAGRRAEVITEQNLLMDQYEAQSHNNSTSPAGNASKTASKRINIQPQAGEGKDVNRTAIAAFNKSSPAATSPTDSQVTFGAPEPTLHALSPTAASPKEATYNSPSYGKETPNNKQISKRMREVEEEDQESLLLDGSEVLGSKKRRKAAIAGEQKLEEIQEKFPFRNKGSAKKRT